MGFDQLADAIVAQINGNTFSPAFVLQRADAPLFSMPELSQLVVTLIPQEITQETSTRGHDKIIYTVEIGFQRKAPPRPQSGEDPILRMTKEIRQLQQDVLNWLSHRSRRRPPNYANAMLMKLSMSPPFVADMLRDHRHYLGVLRLTYEETVRV